MKLLATDECREKFAMRIPYFALFARIQSAAAMTSLVRAIPWSSITSSETIFAPGAAPVWPARSPAAIPATNVPWPRPSPGELPGSVVRLTSAAIRPANSGRVASMPESTTAIVAAGAPGFAPLAQYFCTPVTYGHFSFAGGGARAERRTRASGVIAVTCLSAATARICVPVRSTATPSIEVKVRAVLSETPRTSATACAA